MNGLRQIVAELDRLSLSVDFLNDEDRDTILSTTNERVKRVVSARIVDVRWKKTVEGAPGVLLHPIYSSEPSPNAYFVNESSQGIWSWMFSEGQGKGVWLEDLQNREANQPWPNKANDDQPIDPRYLKIDPQTRSIISVPLLFEEFRDTLWGAFTVEWGEYETPDQDTWNQLLQLANPIARIVWKSDTHRIDQKHTKNAINLYRTAISSASPDRVLNRFRSGFFVRPFRDQFKTVEECVVRYLNRKGIEAQRFVNPVGGHVVINDIITIIRAAHFGIVDITGLNPNVLIECGMLMGLNRPVMFLRNKDDKRTDADTDPVEPFNIRPFEIHQYQVHHDSPQDQPQLQFWDPGDNSFVSAETALDRFVNSLLKNEEFRNAAEYSV